MSWIVLQILGLAVGLTGLALVIAGFLGRRVGGATLCRGCGYDVSATIEEQRSCPECGRAVAGPRGTVTGSRHRRPRLVVAGLLLLLPASATGWYVSALAQPLSVRPSWLLAATLRLGPVSGNQNVARELLVRWRADELGSIGRSAVTDWGLSAWIDGNPARGWEHAEVVRFALAQGAVEATEFDRFANRLLSDASDGSDTRRQRVALAAAASLGPAMRPRLQDALSEPSHRAAAVMLLLDDLEARPTEALVEAAIGALGEPSPSADAGPALDRLPWSIPARRAARFLTAHADACAPRLAEAMRAGPVSRRLLAAAALSEASDQRFAAEIGRAVAPSLGVNAVPGDSVLATRVLLRLGPEAVRAAGSADLDAIARSRLTEIAASLDRATLPPHLERLAGPLPWQDAGRAQAGGRRGPPSP